MADDGVLKMGNVLDDIILSRKSEIKEAFLDEIKKRKKGRKSCDIENIMNELINEGMNRKEAEGVLSELLNDEILEETMFKGKKTIKIKELNVDKTIPNEHALEVEDHNTDSNSDFEDFKRFSTKSLAQCHEEIALLKTQIKNGDIGSPKVVYQLESKDVVIDILRDEVRNLREENKLLISNIRQNQCSVTDSNFSYIVETLTRQLDDKQNTINNLLNNQNHNKQYIDVTTSTRQKDKKDKNHPFVEKDNYITQKTDEQNSKSQQGVVAINKNKNDERNTSHQKSFVCIIGDSMINGVNPNGFSKNITRNTTVKVRPYGGATTEDMLDFIKPTVRKRPEQIILHVGTNDLTNGIDTTKNLKKLINFIKDQSPSTSVCLSSLITRSDKKGLDVKIIDLNKKLIKLCNDNDLDFIDNKNINAGYLSKKKLHLNQKGLSLLANNFMHFLEK